MVRKSQTPCRSGCPHGVCGNVDAAVAEIERCAAAGAAVHAVRLLVVVGAREGALGAALAEDAVLLGGEALAPVVVGHGSKELVEGGPRSEDGSAARVRCPIGWGGAQNPTT